MYLLEHTTGCHDFALWLMAGIVALQAGLEAFGSPSISVLSQGEAGRFLALPRAVNHMEHVGNLTTPSAKPINAISIPSQTLEDNSRSIDKGVPPLPIDAEIAFLFTNQTSEGNTNEILPANLDPEYTSFNMNYHVGLDSLPLWIKSLRAALHKNDPFWQTLLVKAIPLISVASLFAVAFLSLRAVGRLVQQQCQADLRHAIQDVSDWENIFKVSHHQSLTLLDLYTRIKLQANEHDKQISPLQIPDSSTIAYTNASI